MFPVSIVTSSTSLEHHFFTQRQKEVHVEHLLNLQEGPEFHKLSVFQRESGGFLQHVVYLCFSVFVKCNMFNINKMFLL